MEYGNFVGDILWAILLAIPLSIVFLIIGLIRSTIVEYLDRLECRMKVQQMNIRKPKNVMRKPELFK